MQETKLRHVRTLELPDGRVIISRIEPVTIPPELGVSTRASLRWFLTNYPGFGVSPMEDPYPEFPDFNDPNQKG